MPADAAEALGALRRLYRSAPSLFTDDDIEFLRKFAREVRITELELSPRRCRRNHAMEIREGPLGPFWGCGAYPFCHHVAPLTERERLYLAGDETCAPRGLENAVQLTLL
jgi:hypothetical protein